MKRNIQALAAAIYVLRNSRGPQFCLPYEDVTATDACDPNTNGIKQEVLFISRKNITAYPTAATATTATDLGLMEGDYTVAVGKPFKKLQVECELSDVKRENAAPGVGPFKNTLKLFVRGTKDEAEGFANQAIYDEMVFVAKYSDGKRVPIGNEDYAAKCKAMFDSKTLTASDPRGWEFEITSYSKYAERLDAASEVPLT